MKITSKHHKLAQLARAVLKHHDNNIKLNCLSHCEEPDGLAY